MFRNHLPESRVATKKMNLSLLLSYALSVSMSISVSVCLSVCLSVSLSLSLLHKELKVMPVTDYTVDSRYLDLAHLE